MKHVQKEVKMLYAMIGMMECAKHYADYLCTKGANAIHYSVKDKVRQQFNRFAVFKRDILFNIPVEDRKLWDADWNNRDYQTAGSVFESWSNMDDKQRETLEHFAQELEKGQISIEADYISPKDNLPEHGQHVLIIGNDQVTRACIYHAPTQGFAVRGTVLRFAASEVLLWRPDFTEEILKAKGL